MSVNRDYSIEIVIKIQGENRKNEPKYTFSDWIGRHKWKFLDVVLQFMIDFDILICCFIIIQCILLLS